MRISDWSSDVCSSDLLNDRFVELQGILPRGLLLDESTDAADDLGRTPSVLDGTTKRLPDLVQIWRLGTQPAQGRLGIGDSRRSEEHTSELQSLMRISYAVFCLKTKKPSLYTT